MIKKKLRELLLSEMHADLLQALGEKPTEADIRAAVDIMQLRHGTATVNLLDSLSLDTIARNMPG